MSALRTTIAFALLVGLATTAVAGTYVAGGTFVAKTGLGTIVDNGGVICQGTDGSGIGGGCLPFPPATREGGFVGVNDAVAGREVAFQVCIDNNGDGICGGIQTDPKCFDQIFFSHDDAGRFFNPLGPLPTSFREGCAGGFPGYVVLLCQGAHETERGANTHTHALTRGVIKMMSSGSGFGDFCGGGATGGAADGNVSAVAKAYTIV